MVGQVSVRGPRDSVIVFAQFETVVKVVEVTGKVGVKFTHFGDVPLSGVFSFFYSGSCSDHAVMSSGVFTCPSFGFFFVINRVMEASLK